MIAYVSGESARGALLEAGYYYGASLDKEECVRLTQPMLMAFLMHSWDVQEIECRDREDLKRKIEHFWRRDRVIHLSLIAFDTFFSEQLRKDAANNAESLLSEESCLEALLARLYARKLPSNINAEGVSRFLSNNNSVILEEVFDSLVLRQNAINNCVTAWDELPDNLFDGPLEREELRARIVQTGAFYKFASSEGGSNGAIFRILADPVMASKSAKTRSIVNIWAARYKEAPSSPASYFDFEGDSSYRESEGQEQKSSFEIFKRVKKQKFAIREEFAGGHYERGDVLIESLIAEQRLESSPEQLAKSLCDLAIFLRDMGDSDRFFSLALRATQEAPSDAWAYAQLGNAYIAKGDFQGAMSAFEKAQIYGEERASLVGRAETLKYLGQKELALAVLKECVGRFPEDPVAKNSFAAILAYFGQLPDALQAYDDLAESVFAGSHVYGGRASVLASLGRYDEALRDAEWAISLADKNDAIPYCAKADLLREIGRYPEAISVLDSVSPTLLTRLQLDTTRSRIYRDMGDFSEAESILSKLRSIYPRDVSVRVYIAEIYKRRGEFSIALELFFEIEKDFSYSKMARNSMAATLAALGKFEEAMLYLSSRVATTKGDWVGQHIRAMIEMKMGHYADAEVILRDGLQNCPWPQQRPYFASALASLSIRSNDATKALLALGSVEGALTSETELMIDALKAHASVVESVSYGGGLLDLVLTSSLRMTSEPLIKEFILKLEKFCAHPDTEEELWESEWSMLIGMAA